MWPLANEELAVSQERVLTAVVARLAEDRHGPAGGIPGPRIVAGHAPAVLVSRPDHHLPRGQHVGVGGEVGQRRDGGPLPSLRGARRGAEAQPDHGETDDRISVRHELGHRNQAEDPKRKLMVVMIVPLFRASGLVDRLRR